MVEEKRLNVRMDDILLRQLKADAALRGITLSDLIRELAEDYRRRRALIEYATQDKGSEK